MAAGGLLAYARPTWSSVRWERFPAEALGGLGGCPFAQDALVGNVPTEVVLRALAERGAQLPIRKPLENILRMNEDIALRFAR